MTPANLGRVGALFGEHPAPNICDHFHVYTRGRVILEWHDAFYDDPMAVCKSTPEDRVRRFAQSIGCAYELTAPPDGTPDTSDD